MKIHGFIKAISVKIDDVGDTSCIAAISFRAEELPIISPYLKTPISLDIEQIQLEFGKGQKAFEEPKKGARRGK
jgi:hypothetical protein